MDEKQTDLMIFATLMLTGYIAVAFLRYSWVNDHLTDMQLLKNLHNALLWK
jgi:hypothetical protein